MKIKEKWVSWEEFDALFPGLSPTSTIDFQRIGGLTPGSIPFADATGMLTQDNASLFWDEAKAFLGIHETTPTALVHINSVGGAIPALNLESGAEGELVTPDGQQLRFGHWDGAAAFTERFKFDAAGLFYISYLTSGSVIFAGANGEIKQDGANLYWDDGDNRLGVGKFPVNPLDVEGAGTVAGGTSYGGVVARFHNTTAAKHTSISIDALTGYDPVFYLAENGSAIWDLRNDASATDEFQIRYQVGEVNRTDFIIDNAGNVTIPTGTLTLLNEALHLLDTGGDHDLIIKPGEDLGADRILTLVMGDAARTITLSGNPTLGDWFDQAVKQASSPSFAGVYIKSNGELRFYDNGNYVGFEAPALGANQIWVLPNADGGVGEFLQTDGGGNLTWAAVVSTDVKVAVDNLAVADYLGAAFNDGVLRTAAPLSYADGGDFVTLGVDGTVLVDGDFAAAGFMMTDGAGTYSILPGAEVIGADHTLVIGTGAGASLVAGGTYHILIGEKAGNSLTTADYNVHIGFEAGYYSDLEGYNVFIGALAGRGNGAGQGGINCVGIGYQTLWRANACQNNVAVGTQALRLVTSGSHNFALGTYALSAITTQARNIAIGAQAGMYYGHTQSTMIGYFAGAGSVDVRLVAIGDSAGRGKTAGGANFSDCTFVGAYSGGNAVCDQVSIYNTGIGAWSLYSINGGDNNVTIGYKAGYHITTGIGNVCIGYMAGETNLVGDSNELWIANSNTATPLIYGEFPNTLFRITATNINAIGITNLGDGGVTNYASFAVDGTLSLFGTAKVTKRVFLNNAAFTKGGTAPVQVILGFLNGWEFDIGDDAVMTSMVPDDWDTTTNLTIKVCWYIDEAYAADKEIQWRVDWSALPHDFSETVDAPTHTGNISSGDIDIPAVAKRVGTSTVGVIVAADLAAGDMLGFKLSRIAVTHDNPGAKPTAHHLMIEYTADKLGT